MTERRLEPVDWRNVRFEGGFWGPKRERNRRRTLPAIYAHCERTGRMDALRLGGSRDAGAPKPHHFWDSDVAKWLEGASYVLGQHRDQRTRAQADFAAQRFVEAQQPDGYLNTYYLNVAPDQRWTNLRNMHELYCAGHLIEAAVAREEATGKRDLLDAAQRYADHIDARFGPQEGQTRGYPGHQEIELALVRLYRHTGTSRYLDLAKFFLDERGRRPHFFAAEARRRGDKPHDPSADEFQAHCPPRHQRHVVGHAVRAMYMACGMADVAMETGDRELANACRRLWRSATHRRMYVTGGVGASPNGERFTFDYDLPNETAYTETCAAVGLVFFAQRMLQLQPHHEYADVMERALYNNVLAGVGFDGRSFLYANPTTVYPAAEPFTHGNQCATRPHWFGCSCCPPNLARLLGSLGGYVAGVGGRTLYVHLYAQGRLTTTLDGGRVHLTQETDYPWSGRVRLRVHPEAAGRPFTVALRLPGWCERPSLRVNGSRVGLTDARRDGYARLRRRWRDGDTIDLELPMESKRIAAHPDVRMNAGAVALQRGPVVYCIEGADHGPRLHQIALPRDADLTARHRSDLLEGVTVLRARARRRTDADPDGGLYQPITRAQRRGRAQRIEAVPYFAWGNRRRGEMRVWLPEEG